MISMKISGIEFRSRDAIRKVDTGVAKMLRLFCTMMERECKISFSPNAPSKPGKPPAVVTGNLRSSIVWHVSDGRSRTTKGVVATFGVSNNAIYGYYLELGTKRIRPRPWMAPAYKRVKERFAATARSRIKT